MKLAICTDVFADLSYTDMLDKVKSLGIDAVEMTAGGWGARKHCNTAELLADEGKRKEFMGELKKRGMRISALNTSCNPLWPSKTGEEYKKSMYDWASRRSLRWLVCRPATKPTPPRTGSPLPFPGRISWLRRMSTSGR